MQILEKARYAVIPAAMSIVASPAFAAAVEVNDIVTEIKAQIGPITAIGAAVLTVIVAVAAFRWVRRALS